MQRIAPILLCTFVLGLLAACGSDSVPPADAQKKDQHTDLRDAIQRPLDKAKAVDAEVQKATAAQDANIEAQVNGEPAPAASAAGADASGGQ